jgi:glycosyltransferase involved in cell wall biosynthesis
MNILHIETGLNWGGQEFRTLEEIQWLNDHGHRAFLVCQPDSEIGGRAQSLKVPMLAVPVARGANPASLAKVVRLCRREKIDLVHAHSSTDSSISYPLYLMGWPVIRSQHVLPKQKNSFNRTFFHRFGCTRVIATADAVRDDLVARFRVRPAKIDVVGEGIDLSRFNPEADGKWFSQKLDVPVGMPLVGMVAMVRPKKGHVQFVNAAAIVLKNNPDVRFVMAGEANADTRVFQEKLYRNITGARATHAISTPGYIDDVPGLMAAMDVVVVPSLSEAQSRVVPEAFAMRKPVIASRVGGLPELVQDGVTGLLVPPDDPPALAKAILRLLDDPALRQKLAHAGHQKACADLSFDRMMEKTLAVYRKVGVE